MTVIHGEVTKILEIEKDAYAQVITGSPFIDAYSFGGIVAGLSTGYFDITPTTFGGDDFLRSLNISTNSTATQRVYFIKYPEGTVLFDSYFRYDSQAQFFLGDISTYLTSVEYIRVYLENNSVNPRIFQGTIWWVNSNV